MRGRGKVEGLQWFCVEDGGEGGNVEVIWRLFLKVREKEDDLF